MTHALYRASSIRIANPISGFRSPDLPGLVTAGSSLDEARRMAEEALAFHLEGLMEDGEDFGAFLTKTVMTDSVNRDGVATLVSVQPGQKSKHVNLSIPGDVLYSVDQASPKRRAIPAPSLWCGQRAIVGIRKPLAVCRRLHRACGPSGASFPSVLPIAMSTDGR